MQDDGLLLVKRCRSRVCHPASLPTCAILDPVVWLSLCLSALSAVSLLAFLPVCCVHQPVSQSSQHISNAPVLSSLSRVKEIMLSYLFFHILTFLLSVVTFCRNPSSDLTTAQRGRLWESCRVYWWRDSNCTRCEEEDWWENNCLCIFLWCIWCALYCISLVSQQETWAALSRSF